MKFLYILLLITVSSCATQKVKLTEGIYKEVPDSNITSHFFLSGIGQTDIINSSKAEEICIKRGGIATIETKQKFWHVMAQIFTYGIYTPREIGIYCVK